VKQQVLKILHQRYYKSNLEPLVGLEEAFINDNVARKLHEVRTKAGLSIGELANLVGTQVSVICRLEDANYEGYSLSILNLTASALNMRVLVDFVLIIPDTQSR